MCFGCSKEPSHRDGSCEYPQHMFWTRNEENSFPVCALIWRPGKVLSKFQCGKYLVAYALKRKFVNVQCHFILNLGLDARKPVFGDLRTTQAQTSLRIRAV